MFLIIWIEPYHYSGVGPVNNPNDGTIANNTYLNSEIFDISNNTMQDLSYYHPTQVDATPNVFFDATGEGIACNLNCTVRTKNKTDNTSQTASVADLETELLSIFPNPAHDRLTVLIEGGNGDAKMIIYSMQGQEVMRTSVVSGQAYDVSSLTTGLYTISIAKDGVVQHKTLIISK